MDFQIFLLASVGLFFAIALFSIILGWVRPRAPKARSRRKVDCPFCGRSLRPDPGQEDVICDGCEGRFSRKSIRFVPPSLGRRIAGEAMIVLGFLIALNSLRQFQVDSLGDMDYRMQLASQALQVIIFLTFGFSQKKGKVVVAEKETREHAL